MQTILSAISESTRFEIVEILRGGPRSVNEIVEELRLPQPQVSKHLHVLCEAGIVEKLPQAQRRIYSLRAQPFEELGAWLSSFKSLWDERMDRIDALLREQRGDGTRDSSP